jgi:transposase
MNPETVQEWFRILREAIYAQALRELAILCGEIEMNETLFGGRVSGTRG